MLAIDIKSEFGAFSKPFSNVGGLLTYEIPPKTTLMGMIGAILGYSFSETKNKFKRMQVGIQPLKGVKTERMVYTSHYGGRKGRIMNIKQELLIKPKYRIFLQMENVENGGKILKDIKGLLEHHGIEDDPKNLTDGLKLLLSNNISFYSLYMGRNAFPLEYKLQDEDLKEIDPTKVEGYLPTKVAIPKDSVSNYRLHEKEGRWFELPEPFYISLCNNVPVSYLLEEEGKGPTREIKKFKDFILPPPKGKFEVIPQGKPNYSYYIDTEGNFVVLF